MYFDLHHGTATTYAWQKDGNVTVFFCKCIYWHSNNYMNMEKKHYQSDVLTMDVNCIQKF